MRLLGDAPGRRARYFAWALMSLLSFFFAEIVSGASMIDSFAPAAAAFKIAWSVLVTIPLYGLHLLVLAWLVARFGKLRFYSLFLAGAIFGLYEAYITKMIWSPTWDLGPSFAGLSVVTTAMLVLWWHPLMAFIVPLFASEAILARSRETLAGLPRPLAALFSSRKCMYLAIAGLVLFCGLFQGSVSPSPVYSLFNTIAVSLLTGALIFVYRGSGYHRYDLRQLLPRGKEVIALSFLLAGVYAFGIMFIRPEAMPGLGSQLAVWVLYMLFGALLALSLRNASKITLPLREFPGRYSWKLYAALFTTMAMVSAAFSLVPPRLLFALLCWFAGIGLGTVLLACSAGDALRMSTNTQER